MRDAATPQLDYAPPASRRRRRRRRAALAVLLVLTVVAGTVTWRRYGPTVRQRLNDMALDRACLRYTAPPDFVVFEQEPAAAERLLASGKGYVTERSGGKVLATYAPPEWMNYPEGRWTPGPAFLHERTSPGGNRRLVAVAIGGARGWEMLYGCVHVPTTLRADRRVVRGVRARAIVFPMAPRGNLRIFAGQPDAADPSHFTITLEHNDVPTVIDGWLRDDDTLTFEPRGGTWEPSFYAPGGSAWRPPGAATRTNGPRVGRDATP